MPTSRKVIGIDQHLDTYYPEQGGSAKFHQLLELEVPLRRIAKQFGVSRPTINNWRKQSEGR